MMSQSFAVFLHYAPVGDDLLMGRLSQQPVGLLPSVDFETRRVLLRRTLATATPGDQWNIN